jgi:uncharacterized protein YceK
MRLVVVALCVLSVSGCVSTRTAQIENEKAAALRGKVVAMTDRPRAGFVAMTPGKAMFALIGAAAMIEAGKTIVKENDIPDAAPIVDHALLLAAQEHYGAISATTPPVQIDTTDVGKLADAAKGADVLFDVQGVGAQFRYLPLNFGKYVVDSSYKFRIIDVHARKLIAEGFCAQSTKDDPTPPSRDELLADKAARLKAILNAQRDQCTNQFATQVLSLPGQPTAT